MKSPLIISLLAVVLGAVALVSSLAQPRWEELGERAVPAEPSWDGGADVVDRMEQLGEDNRALRDRISMLEQLLEQSLGAGVSSRAPVTDGFVLREEFEAFQDEVREALAGREVARAKGAVDSAMKEQVASTLGEIRKDETAAKLRSWQESRVARLDKTMPKLEASLGLTSDQSSQLRSALLTQYDREAELTRRWEAGEDAEVLGELKRTDREAHVAELSGILSPEQLENYSARQRGGK